MFQGKLLRVLNFESNRTWFQSRQLGRQASDKIAQTHGVLLDYIYSEEFLTANTIFFVGPAMSDGHFYILPVRFLRVYHKKVQLCYDFSESKITSDCVRLNLTASTTLPKISANFDRSTLYKPNRHAVQ